MARIRVKDGETTTTEVDLASGDRLLVAAGGTIARGGTAPAVRILGAEATILNQGTISTTAASGAAVTGALSGDLAIRIANQGTIQGATNAIAFSSAAGTTGDFTLLNSGTIAGGTSQAVTLKDLRASTITILNQDGGLITNSGTADVLRPGNDLATAIRVVNAGTIMAGDVAGANESGDGVDFQSNAGGLAATVVNQATGHIEGGKHGITGANDAFIVNQAGGEIIGRNGSGLNFDTLVSDGDGAVRVVNHGLISGRFDGVTTGDGDGVDVDYLVTIRNDGRIEGVNADNVDNFADGVAAGGGRIVNLEGGEIFGETNGVLIDDGDRGGAYSAMEIVNFGSIESQLGNGVRMIGIYGDTIFNRGEITGAIASIDMGGGDDAVLNSGSLIGDVLLGAGNDDFRGGGTVAGSIFGEAGDDTLVGGRERDRIVGGTGHDFMSGLGGADTYVYTSLDDAPFSFDVSKLDLVVFGRGDTIDLSAIDADTNSEGDQAFTLVFAPDGTTSGEAGEAVVSHFSDHFYYVNLFTQTGGQPQAAILVLVDDPTTLSFVL
jgi:hypothetical protein